MMPFSRTNRAFSSSATLDSAGRLRSTSPMIAMPRLWKVRTVTWAPAWLPRRLRTLSSISFWASFANASNSSSDGRRYCLRISQPALATITEVLPLPAAATTRFRSSSTTTALRCSSVRGLDSILSKSSFDRTNSFTTKVSLAFARRPLGLIKKSCAASNMRISILPDRASGH